MSLVEELISVFGPLTPTLQRRSKQLFVLIRSRSPQAFEAHKAPKRAITSVHAWRQRQEAHAEKENRRDSDTGYALISTQREVC